MTSKFTREELLNIIETDHVQCGEASALARMALAAMDSEPVAVVEPSDYVTAAQLVGEGPARKAVHELYEGALRIGDKLYRHAQTAPVVPEEKPMSNPLSMYAVDAVAAIAEAKGWNACRAAMLQHQPQNAQQNIPENIPGGLVEAVNNLLNNDGSRGCYDAMECGTAREKIELWLAQRQRWEEQRKANLSAGNSPVIPDGYVMVPMRLTAENGAKGALSGEFSETKFVNCPECFGDDECETCDGSGRIEITVPVTWTTIKEIWAKGVEHFAAALQEVKGE
ncbi:hypothetical protein LUS60_20610 [Raoultella planticola]|nr:hypothetical protein [Raoultella planticola]MCD9607673.1 hypothetical protein [Raoultella planticola]